MDSHNINNFFTSYKDSLIDGLNLLDLDQLTSFVGEIEKMSAAQNTLYILGNGGSAATASHFVNDLFSLNLKYQNFKLKAESLTDNTSIITALGNDYSFDEIFVQQLKTKMAEGDGILVLSASGNSSNLVKAVEWVKEQGHRIFSMTGFDGGRVRELSDFSLHIETAKGEYEKAEDLHLLVNHFIRYYLQRKYA